MPGRLPKPFDFTSTIHLTITPPPLNHQPVNILILLHGLGDTNAPFSNLGKQLSLPETACISLQAPTPLPFNLGGFHWGDDIVFDQTSGQMDVDTGFSKATILLKDIIENGLGAKCGYSPQEIVLFGLGQGAMAALAAALPFPEDLGGIISIGGPLPISKSPLATGASNKSKTPVLVLGGSSNTLITPKAIITLKTVFEFLEYSGWVRSQDGMPRSREEMLPIMQFFSRRLKSRRGIPQGSVEIG